MSLGYKNATGDDRRLFMRFLPTPWRNLTDEKNNTHNAILGSLTTLAETEENDLKESKDESFLDTASGVFLNKWGNFSGVHRHPNEADEHYRKRIKKWFVKKKGTVNSLIDNILDEFEDDNLDVYIYEPWRNIFYLNSSLLNGVDHLQGHYYRFAVIDIHISSNIDVSRLSYIVDRYKDAGVMVYFTYENGMNLDASTYDLQLSSRMFAEGTVDFNGSNYLQDIFPIGALANPDYIDADAFYTNKSELNGKDILSGSPYRDRNTYNFIGYGPLDKTLDPDDSLSDMILGITEYDSLAYKLANSQDGIGYKIDNHNKQYKKSDLVRLIVLSINFYIDSNGQLQYHVDTDDIVEDEFYNDYSYYVDVALAHIDFRIVGNEILAYVAKPITDESNQVINMINDAVNDLIFTISDAGDIRFNGIYSASTYALDLARMYSFYPEGNHLGYERTDYVPTLFNSSETKAIEENFSFQVDGNKILAYVVDSDKVPNSAMVGLNELNLIISDGKVVANIAGSGSGSDGLSYAYELSKMAEFKIIGDNLTYNWTDYKPAKFTKNEILEIKNKVSFKLVDSSRILAFVNDVSVSQHIKDAIDDLYLVLLPDGTVTTGILYNPDILTDKDYNIAMDTLMFFDWKEYYLRHRGVFSRKSNFRYIKIKTQGSPYGYNSGELIAKDKNNNVLSNNAKWIKIGNKSISIDNKSGISDPYISTSEYVLDLGKVYDVASLTLGDRFIGDARRIISVSNDGNIFQPVAVINSTGGDIISTANYEDTNNKSDWIKNNVNSALFKVAIKDTTKVSELAVYNFNRKSWDNITLIPGGNQVATINVDLGSHLSNKGVFVARLNAEEHQFTLDYAGFNVEWLQYNEGTSISLDTNMFMTK